MSIHHTLKIVREQRRLALSEVADFVAISASRLEEFEEGARDPSPIQLEKLAEAYGVPAYAFYASRAPNFPENPVDFRKTDPAPASVSPRGLKSLLAAEKISRFSAQLATELSVNTTNFTKTNNDEKIEEKATRIRATFDRWLNSKVNRLGLTGTSEQVVLGAFRLFFEIQGGVVNINTAPEKDYMGFFLNPDAGLPTIFVNRKIMSKKAQLFTFAHEYCHFLLMKEGISNPFVVKNSVERSCNKFAAEFLAPMSEFKYLVESKKKPQIDSIFEWIRNISANSLLSQHATAIRLLEAGYIKQRELSIFESVWRRNPSGEKEQENEEREERVLGAPHAKRANELGYFPIYLASKARKKGLVDSIDIQSGIGLSEKLQEKAFSLVERRFEVALQ